MQGHLKGDRNYTNEIHKVLTLEILHRLFLDNPERGGFEGRPGMVAATERTRIVELDRAQHLEAISCK